MINDFQAEAYLRQAVWMSSARAIDRIRASGSVDFSELSVLEAIYPELGASIIPVVPTSEEPEDRGVAESEDEDAAKVAVEVEDAI